MAKRGPQEEEEPLGYGANLAGDRSSQEDQFYDENESENDSFVQDEDTSGRGSSEEEEGEEDGQSSQSDAAGTVIPGVMLHEQLGFQRARRKLSLPGVAFAEGEVDDGRLSALAAVDRFGLTLVSCASGEGFVK